MKSHFIHRIAVVLCLAMLTAVTATANSTNEMLLVNQGLLKHLTQVKDSLDQLDEIQRLKLDLVLSSSKDADEIQKANASLSELAENKTSRATAYITEVEALRKKSPGVPVLLDGDTLFLIYSKLGPYPPTERAENITNKLNWIIEQNLFNQDLITVSKGEDSHDIVYRDIILTSVTLKDALWESSLPNELAEQRKMVITKAMQSALEKNGIVSTLLRFGALVLLLTIVYFGVRFMNKGFTWLNKQLISKWRPHATGLKIKNYELFSSVQLERTLMMLLKAIKWVVIAFVIYLSLPTMFSIFPSTKGVATALFGYVLTPLKHYGLTIISYIPKLITVAVIILITRYLIRFLKFIAGEVEQEKLKIPGFYADWARPSFNILRIVIWAFSFVIIFPYLPGSGSTVFQGVSVFFGLLISLGSSSAISNIIAGLVITYMRAFKIGDRVKIGDTTGDVIEKTMLVTRLRTIKNEDVTIPNSAILNGSTVNFSSSAKELGLVLHTTVTIGYDVDWRKVHELLVDAASKVPAVQKNPAPFVLQTSLDDFYVSYELNAYTSEAASGAKIYSEIHANIQDNFSDAEIEILSPHYRAQRDGSAFTVPPEKVPNDFKPAPFNVKIHDK